MHPSGSSSSGWLENSKVMVCLFGESNSIRRGALNKWAGKIGFNDLDEESKLLLIWVKTHLTKMAKEKKNTISDFSPKNTMFNEQNQPVIVDPSAISDDDDWDIIDNIYKYTKAWSNNNPEIFKFLSEKYPLDIQAEMSRK